MTKMALGSHPFLLGFEQLERLVERTAKSDAGGYPPYNIEQVSEREYRITLAVAGFPEEALEITVEDRQLVVRGRQCEPDGERIFLHRGIASRQFQRTFVLADGVEVTGAGLKNGLLHLDLERAPQDRIVRTIAIERDRSDKAKESET
ncbi:Hsp20 family protein [Palleronia sp. LCG004]|uniref:Hsp20 family protein n=1 Tax=Palleronia sp. LCG004 TaxID=3079304 RepID=UPI002943F64E|nr:Hsp20 family protein [Palleronia sp. LCG004]WOI56462.1 Hsp20 family protein [Palleronia sp. LCG004]